MSSDAEHILVFSSDEQAGHSLTTILRDGGHRVTVARDGRHAFDALSHAAELSLAVVDLTLEAPPAVELIERLRANVRHDSPALIGLVPSHETSLLDAALSAGVDDFIFPPLIPSLVSARVDAQLRNRHLDMALAEQRQDLELLLDLTWRLAATVDVREILFELVSRIAGALNVDRCSLILADGGRKGVVLAASDNATLDDLEIDLDAYPEVRQVLSSGEPLVLQDAKGHPLLATVKDTLAAQGVGALAAFPLQHHDEPMGVLLLRALAEHGPFSDRAIRLARTIAHATAIALRNARLFERISRESAQATKGKVRAEQEVADLKQIEAELRKTKSFLENLIDSSNDAIVASDMRGNILVWNKTAERILGYSREEAAGLHVSDIYHDDARAIMSALRSENEGGRGRLEERSVHVLSRDRERIPVTLSAAVLYEDGRELATVGLLTDIRHRLQIEEKLSAAQTRLLESEKARAIAELAGTTAHELNQPLTSIMGYAELLKRRLPKEDSNQRAVDIIFRESDRMAGIVRKIGRITRYETKNYLGKTRIVDLDRSVDEED